MVVKILISSNDILSERLLFNVDSLPMNSGICLTTTEEFSDIEGIQTVFTDKNRFYTEFMNITPRDNISDLPDVSLYCNLGIQGDLVMKCRLIKPHIVIHTETDKITRSLSGLGIEIRGISQKFCEHSVKYLLYFEEEIEITSEMVANDIVNQYKFKKFPYLRYAPFVPSKIREDKSAGRSYLICNMWLYPKTYEFDILLDEFVKELARRVSSDLLLEHIKTIEAENASNDKARSIIKRIGEITNELAELKKSLEELF